MSSHDNHQPDQYSQSARVRLSSPTDILDIVPALIGFYPTESLCALYLDETSAGRTLALTARADLPTTPDELTGLLAHTADMLTRYPTAILVAYAADQEQARDTVRQVAQRFGPDRIVTGIIAAPQGWTTVDPCTPPPSSGPTRTRPGPDRPPQPSPPRASTPWAPATTSATASPPRRTDDRRLRPRHHRAGPPARADRRPARADGGRGPRVHRQLPRPAPHRHRRRRRIPGRPGLLRSPAGCRPPRDRPDPGAVPRGPVARRGRDDPRRLRRPVLGLLGIAAWVAGNGALANIASNERTPTAT